MAKCRHYFLDDTSPILQIKDILFRYDNSLPCVIALYRKKTGEVFRDSDYTHI